jgi:hypothetical protein
MRITDPDAYLENFHRKVILDSYAEASARYWRRRADIFAAALPRTGDFTGNATAQEIEERRQRIAATILACRERAELMPGGRIE